MLDSAYLSYPQYSRNAGILGKALSMKRYISEASIVLILALHKMASSIAFFMYAHMLDSAYLSYPQYSRNAGILAYSLASAYQGKGDSKNAIKNASLKNPMEDKIRA